MLEAWLAEQQGRRMAPGRPATVHLNGADWLVCCYPGAEPAGGTLIRIEVSCRSSHGRALDGLTTRERDVGFWVSRGLSNRAIADLLGIRPATVKKHLEHIYVKLGVDNRTHAASILVPPRDRPGPGKKADGTVR